MSGMGDLKQVHFCCCKHAINYSFPHDTGKLFLVLPQRTYRVFAVNSVAFPCLINLFLSPVLCCLPTDVLTKYYPSYCSSLVEFLVSLTLVSEVMNMVGHLYSRLALCILIAQVGLCCKVNGLEKAWCKSSVLILICFHMSHWLGHAGLALSRTSMLSSASFTEVDIFCINIFGFRVFEVTFIYINLILK